MTTTDQQLSTETIEGMERALEIIVAYGSKLGHSISAYPGNRDGAAHAAYELYIAIQEAKGIPLDSEEGERNYISYLRSWKGWN